MEPVSPTSRKPRRLKWFILGALVLIFTAVVILFFIFDTAAHRVPSEIQARIDALKKAGYPVSAEDLDNLYPPLPDHLNSALIYQKATNFTVYPVGYTNWPIFGESIETYFTNSLPPEVKLQIGEYLRQNQAIFDRLHKAAGLEKGYYELGYKNGFAGSSSVKPPVVEMHRQAQFLSLSAVFQADDHQPGLATQKLLDLSGLARSLQRDPRMVCQLIRLGILGYDFDTLEFVLNRLPLSEENLSSLAQSFDRVEVMSGLKLGLITDRCFGIWFGHLVMTNAVSSNASILERIQNVYYRIRYHRTSDFIFYLDMSREFIAACDLPCPQNLEAAKQVESKVEKSAAYQREREFEVVLRGIHHKVFESALRSLTKLHLAQTAIAVERYRLANQDRIPDSLAALVPAYLPSIPIYPFDGQPLRLKPLPHGYVLCSSTSIPGPEITFTVAR